MDLKNYIEITDAQLNFIDKISKEYKEFDNYDSAVPKVIVGVPNGNNYSTPDKINSAELMLKDGLDTIKNHILVGDDYVPQIRVEFGTGQFAHAFGCEMYIPEDSPVCSKGHVLDNIELVDKLDIPDINAGWFKKSYEFAQFFMENKPDFVGLQLPDFQSPFNNAHLIRGNDILLDFYDYPDELYMLFNKMAQYHINLVKHYREITNMEEGFFFDWGAIWKGVTRLSNCSLHMISTQFYEDYIKTHDSNIFKAIGGGRIHYCGEHDDGLINSLCNIPNMTGLDVDGSYHSPWELSEIMPKNIPLLIYPTESQIDKIISGDIPKKRNIIIQTSASTVEEAKELYNKIKNALCK